MVCTSLTIQKGKISVSEWREYEEESTKIMVKMFNV